MLDADQLGFAAPLFSYQAIVSSSDDADKISMSPSPSISATKTCSAPSALVAILDAVKVGVAPPLFSYQAIVSSQVDAETISRSPSPSMSAAKTLLAPSASIVIIDVVQLGFSFPSFTYQAILSSKVDAEIISISPSLSRSAAKTEYASSALVEISSATQVGSVASAPPKTKSKAIPKIKRENMRMVDYIG